MLVVLVHSSSAACAFSFMKHTCIHKLKVSPAALLYFHTRKRVKQIAQHLRDKHEPRDAQVIGDVLCWQVHKCEKEFGQVHNGAWTCNMAWA